MDLFLNKILKFDFVKDSRSSLSFQRMADIQLKRRLDRSCLPQFQLWPIFDLSDKIISNFWTKVTLVHTVRCKLYLAIFTRGYVPLKIWDISESVFGTDVSAM